MCFVLFLLKSFWTRGSRNWLIYMWLCGGGNFSVTAAAHCLESLRITVRVALCAVIEASFAGIHIVHNLRKMRIIVYKRRLLLWVSSHYEKNFNLSKERNRNCCSYSSRAKKFSAIEGEIDGILRKIEIQFLYEFLWNFVRFEDWRKFWRLFRKQILGKALKTVVCFKIPKKLNCEG